MGIQDLQALFENEGVSVDLFRIGRNHAGGFRLVLDAEGCLDRLYGGYFSDWACGGQWARCVQFFVTLKSALTEHHVSVCICFNGAHPSLGPGGNPMPPAHWAQQQAINRQRINSVLRHIAAKGTPPPKVWWVPPAGLHSCLRNALRYLNVPVMVSTDDHHQEVVNLCRERGYAGIVGNSGEYLVFQPPRYFCSSRLKLTYRSSLETKEYMVHDLQHWLEVPQDRLCIVAALLGNTILTEQHLADFYKRLSINQKKINGETLIKSVANYVKDLPNKDLDAICLDLFGSANDTRNARFKQSVQYYVNGTKEGFLKYKSSAGWKTKNRKPGLNSLQKESDLDTSRLASEVNAPDIGEFKLGPISCNYNDWPENIALDPSDKKLFKNGTSNNSSTKGTQSTNGKEAIKCISPFPIEVLRTCADRHSKGLMAPSLLTILMHRQITLPVLLEDENHREIPSIHHLFRPIRQHVYAILFNMHHFHFMAARSKDGEKMPNPVVSISEWIYTRRNPGKTAEVVQGVMLEWPVPTVQRLWFGTTQDDKCRRLRAFLSCMRSDSPLMLNTSYVPQHLLILATVLRYIMTSPIQCLRRQELDAFLATAFAADLMNPLHLQEMTLSGVTVRGVQLGALLMTGIDAALLANDACGAPVYWPFTSPWMFFDGKLFQQKLARANTVKNLVQLCDNQVDVVIKVERMRKAILEGLNVDFAMPPLPMNPNVLSMAYPPPGVLSWSNTKGRGTIGTAHRGAGGRLEIAGVVVGQWGANYARSAPTPRYNNSQIGYPTYTPQHSSFVTRGRGIGGRGRAMGMGGRGGLSRRTRHRATRPTAPRRRPDAPSGTSKDTPVNGKPAIEENKISTNGRSDPTNGDALADSTTDGNQNDQTSDNGESTDPSYDNSTTGDGNIKASQSKITKINKKNVLKSKKKPISKTDVPTKSEDIKFNDTNGQITENCGAKNTKIPAKTAVAMVNGGNGTIGDHKGQSDSPQND